MDHQVSIKYILVYTAYEVRDVIYLTAVLALVKVHKRFKKALVM